mmetsp:Transcript_31805/g.65305  ORF Transcript_31805/g.65305 Transcript_31805/m.65305 type:complete len:897 (-) Transcript_31805:96-2786(-)
MDYDYYHNLRLKSNSTRRAGNVKVYNDPQTGEEIGICHLNGYLWISDEGIEPDVNSIDSIAGALMAMHHVNTGDGSIVSELEGIHTRCPVRFTGEFADTMGNELMAVSMLARVVGGNDDSLPCGILGATRSASVQPMSMLSASYNLPQMSWEATSDELKDKEVYPLFARVVVASSAIAEATYHHLSENLKVKNIAILYVNDGYGISFLRTFQGLAQRGGIRSRAFAYPPAFTEDELREAVQSVKETGYRYIFYIGFPENVNFFLKEAVRQELTGEDYFWFFGNEAMFEEIVDKDSLLDQAYNGVGFLQPSAGREGFGGGYDAFLSAWRNLDSAATGHFSDIVPKYPNFEYNFTSEVPIGWAMLAYDTVVAMGLAACEATADGEYFNGTELLQNLPLSFDGASGLVKFENSSSTRQSTSSLMEIVNLKRNGVEGGKVKYEASSSTVLQPNVDGSLWNTVQISPFIYADGTTTAPPDLPPINDGKGVDYHYIGKLRILGYLLASVVAVTSISFAGWTFHNRKTRVARASQPPFLVIICVGAIIMASSIITMSFDDQYFSTKAASVACMATPWLLSTGFATTFSALFSKTWRINKVLTQPNRFQRVTVGVKDVISPFIAFFTTNSIILICWTILAPLEFIRTANKVGTDQFNRTISSYGSCMAASDTRADPTLFAGFLAAWNTLIVAFTTYQAYVARNISTDYSESKYIAYCIVSILQAFIMGIPIVILLNQSEDAHRTAFLVQSLFVFIVTMVILLLIFVPKILHCRSATREKASNRQKSDGLLPNQTEKGLHFSISKGINMMNGLVRLEGGGPQDTHQGERSGTVGEGQGTIEEHPMTRQPQRITNSSSTLPQGLQFIIMKPIKMVDGLILRSENSRMSESPDDLLNNTGDGFGSRS